MARFPAAGKTIAVVLALLLAGVATFAIYAYVRGIEERALADAEPVQVFIAQELVPAGTSASDADAQGLIEQGVAPQVNVPEGAIVGLDQIDGLVASERILPGEIIVGARWAEPGEATVQFNIPDGFEAISLQVGLVPGVAGFIQTGDRISMIASLEAPGVEDSEAEEDGEQQEPDEVQNLSQYLLQDVEVLAVAPRGTVPENEEAPGSIILTVALEPERAEQLVFGIQNAALHLTLLPDGAEPRDTEGRTLDNLFDD